MYDNLKKILQNRRSLFSKRPFVVLLNITHACNFACDYCFATTIRDYCTSSGQPLHQLKMSEDIAFKAIDYAVESIKTQGIEELDLTFFGGEPLLEFDLLKRVHEYSRDQAAKAGIGYLPIIVTNGSLLTPGKIEYFAAENFKVSISLDGNKLSHDRHRKYPNGRGTYDSIIDKVRMTTAAIKNTSVVCTLTEGNNLLESYLHFEELGFSEMQIEVEHDFCVSEKFPPYQKQLIQWEQQLLRLIARRRTAGNGYMKYKPLSDLIDICRTGIPLTYPECGAGVNMVCIDIDGDVYPCGCFVGLPEFLIDKVKRKVGLSDGSTSQRFHSCKASERHICRECTARDYCGGGCHFNAFHKNKTIDAPAADCARRKALVKHFQEIFQLKLPS